MARPEQFNMPVIDDLAAERFLIVDELHRNDQAGRAVFESLDVVTGLHTALKLTGVRESSGNPRELDIRTKREVYLAETLVHPNVARAIGSGILSRSPAGYVHYLAMPFANQGDLRYARHSVRDKRSAAKTWGLFLDSAVGLQAMHDAGYIHGDVKIQNILAHNGQGLITDFGSLVSAHDMPGCNSGSYDPIEWGWHNWTLGYASPEQMNARSRDDIDNRSDIFSWGVSVLCKLNSGLHPFINGGRTPDEQRAAVIKGQSHVPFMDYIPRDVYRLLLQCTDTNRDKRPDSFDAVIMAARTMFDDDYVDDQLPKSKYERRVQRQEQLRKALYASKKFIVSSNRATSPSRRDRD